MFSQLTVGKWKTLFKNIKLKSHSNFWGKSEQGVNELLKKFPGEGKRTQQLSLKGYLWLGELVERLSFRAKR